MFPSYAALVFLEEAASHPLDHCELSVSRLPKGVRGCVAEASEARGRAPRKGWHRGRGGTFHRSSLLRICEGLAPPWGAGARCVAMRCLGCTHHRLALRPQPSSCSSSSCPVPPTPTPPASDSSSSLRFRSQFGREWWDSPEGTRSTWITVNYQRSGSPWGSEGSELALHATGPTLIEGLAPPHGQQREAELVPHLPRSWCHPYRGARPHPYKGGADSPIRVAPAPR